MENSTTTTTTGGAQAPSPALIAGLSREEARAVRVMMCSKVPWGQAAGPLLAEVTALVPAAREAALVLINDGQEPRSAIDCAKAL